VVRWKDGAPCFYVSRRVGERGRPFRLYKIRTMSESAERGPLGSVTTGDDPRVTVTGRVLRRWKIDELPQLLNVLLGDMSMVGPRPETPEYVALYTEEQREILRYRPGITSPASITFIREAELLSLEDDPVTYYAERIMPEEIRIDLTYMRRATVWSDMTVLLKTAIVALGSIGGGR
jgi:lipopolysaccharide/colanic/teichoic acid biosynthesis glycosyltransferase